MMDNFLQQLALFAAAQNHVNEPSCIRSAVIPDHGLMDEASGTTEFQISPPSSKHASDLRHGMTPAGDPIHCSC